MPTTGGEAAVTVKSAKENVAVAECVSKPMAPVTVTVKLPATDALHDNVAVAGDGGRVALPGLIAVQVRPVGSGVSDRATVPEKPLMAVTMIVD